MTDLYLSNLYIETTRRCNMNCIHCAKGKAQDLDISKEIIDKTMNELKNTYIHFLDIIGGETFLNIEGLEYTIDSIIKNRIKVFKVFMFTGSAIKDIRIVNAIHRLADYIKQEKPLFADDTKKYCSKFSSINYRYKTDVSEKDVVIVASTNYHDNSEMVNKTVKYYNSHIKRDNAIALSQNDDIFLDDVYLNFEGNLVDNYNLLPENAVKRLRFVDNQYCIIDDSVPDIILIDKAITVSANGNVFVGNLSSYEKVDNQLKMFNILNCNNDFYSKISEWCWLHPATAKIRNTREKYNSYLWLKQHSLLDDEQLEIAYSKINMLYGLSYCIDTLKRLHSENPKLNHHEIDMAFNCTLLLDMENYSDIEKEMMLILFSSFKDCEHKDIIKNYHHNAEVARKSLITLFYK